MSRDRYPSRESWAQRRGRAISAKSVIAGAIPKIAIAPRLREYRIRQEWPKIVGEAIAKRTMPKALIKDTLYCVVTSAAWMTELNFQKPLIIDKINNALASGSIKAIVFKPGVLPKAKPEAPEAPAVKNTLSEKCIKEATSTINDDSLRKLISRVMKKSPF